MLKYSQPPVEKIPYYSELMSEWMFGEYIERRLNQMGGKKAGRHLAWLAETSGISDGYIHYLVKGEASGRKGKPKPTIDMLLALSKALNIPESKLILAYQGKDPDIEASTEAESVDLQEVMMEALNIAIEKKRKEKGKQ